MPCGGSERQVSLRSCIVCYWFDRPAGWLVLLVVYMLQDVRKFKLGLYYALRFQQASQQRHQQQQLQGSTEADLGGSSWSNSGGAAAAAGGVKSSAGAGLARSEGLGAEPQQIEQWMLSLTLGHATATLQEAATTHDGQLQQQVPWPGVHSAAEVCVCACLMLSRVDVLFQRVYPLFARPDLAGVGAVGVFVEVLESAVLSDLLESLPPEVMQVGETAAVEHFGGSTSILFRAMRLFVFNLSR